MLIGWFHLTLELSSSQRDLGWESAIFGLAAYNALDRVLIELVSRLTAGGLRLRSLDKAHVVLLDESLLLGGATSANELNAVILVERVGLLLVVA